MSSKKADYGIDAPGVIRTLMFCSFGFLLLGLALGFINPYLLFVQQYHFDVRWACFGSTLSLSLSSLLMYNYSTNGKLKHRNRIINMIEWKGDEKVLDVGTGRGLLMIGAAKKLESGKATGIDIWNDKDLSGNEIENTRVNVLRESVSHKTFIKNDDARKMSFADDSFDVVLSNLCLHNIEDKSGRKKAIKEIIRVLKPGGVAIISDFKNIDEYVSVLSKEGLKTTTSSKFWMDTFPPLSIIRAEKV